MQPIELYRGALAGTKQSFIAAHPTPFLMYSGGALREVKSSDPALMTIDRFVVEGQRAPSRVADVFVAAITPREAGEVIVTIGTNPTCDIEINDTSVSKQHAWFQKSSDGWQLWDNDSVGGTRVNDEVLQTGHPHLLASGDVITLGYVELTFLTSDAFYSVVKHLAR
ncbi:MAG TPA: FHA domain-containing protein [Kofleriaceae bacterium]|jgi:pyruvate/2-oxoglutarate dehydrogenase complex dihydrolipoamide dehydrogenase (E3) component